MKRLSLLICLPLLLGACNSQEQQSLEQQFDTVFSSYFQSDRPGGAVLIAKGNEVLFENGYGIADINTKEAITPNTVFNTGSISKTFVANGILILEERGLLSLDDNLSKYFPGFKNKELANSLTIEHLLSHSSGLPDLRGVRDSTEYYLNADDMQNFKPLLQADASLFEPGSKFMYSNPGYNGLAMIIEQITGERWQEFIVNEIFKSSGMTKSVITDGSFPDTGVSHAYVHDSDKDTWIEADYGETPTWNAAGNGGVWSTVRDLAAYQQALNQSLFLSNATIRKSQTPYVEIDRERSRSRLDLGSMGHSWFIEETDSVKYVGHTGSQGGFISDFLTVKEKDILYVLLCNTPADIFKIREDVLNVLAKNDL